MSFLNYIIQIDKIDTFQLYFILDIYYTHSLFIFF